MPADSIGIVHRLLRAWGHQDWIRFGLRDRLLRHLAHPDRRPGPSFGTPFFGYRYEGTLESYIDWSVYFYGAYEKQEVVLLQELARRRPGTVMLDVGANVGHHSLALASACAEIHAFEPYGPLCEIMRRRLQDNRIANVHLHAVGLAERACVLPYSAPSGANLGTGSFADVPETADTPRLSLVRGDDFLAELGVGDVHLVKIDVEGFEKNVLAGLQATIRQHRPIVFMEYSPTTKNSFGNEAELLRLIPEGYAIHAVETNLPLLGLFAHRRARVAPFDFERFEGNLLLVPEGS